MTELEINILVENLISIRDDLKYDGASRKTLDALAKACNLIYDHRKELADK